MADGFAASLHGGHHEALEQFNKVLEELAADSVMDPFKVEYEKLHRALRKTYESQARLAKKCQELNSDISANAAKVQNALKLNEEDRETALALKREIDKAWKMVDDCTVKETKAKETAQQLKVEIANLTRLVEEGAGLAIGEETTLNELLKQKEELAREREAQVEQLMRYRSDLMATQDKLRAAEADKLQLEADIQHLCSTISDKKTEAEREIRKKERMEKDMKELRQQLEMRTAEIKSKQLQMAATEEQVARLEQMLRDAKFATEKVQKEYNMLNERMQKLHHDLEEQIHTNTQLLTENSAKQVELRAKEEEISGIKQEASRVNKLREQTVKKTKQLEEQRVEVEKERDALRAELASLERDLDSKQKEVDVEKKKLEELTRERDVLTKLRSQAENATQKQIDLVKINENAKRNLEQEIQGYKMEAQKQSKLIYQLEKEREKYDLEAAEANSKYQQAQLEVKLRVDAIMDLQKRIAEGEGKLKQQQNLYEAVRADRNLYSKNLIEAQDEIQEMKRKFKIMQHQIEQLKEEITGKDLYLLKEHFEHQKVINEKEQLRNELDKSKGNIKEADSAINAQKVEIDKLNHIINEADQERRRQKKEYDIVVNERDILGTQLVRRNDELAALYERVKIQQATLQMGQSQYRDQLGEIRQLKVKLADLKQQLHLLKSSVSSIDVLKREVHQLGRELLQERTKVKALSEELENPLNVHRWRKLEGSDPGTYEMIQKIQTLQKRLIAKTEEVVEKDLLIQEKEKLYMELKNILARQPGPEVAEQLSIYQANLREKTKQMKAMASELNMYQAQVNEYKYEIERLVRELNEMKLVHFERRKKEQSDKARTQKASMYGPSLLDQLSGGSGSGSGGLALGGKQGAS
ncbi:hypothetical protein HYH02_003307 [Chlamydomonas schloesseri]|uniref:Cilia- and flagella-associated protein 58 central coiled coil domain-containing protein n=1 Tax=Chlamydomonas schloesseri TaxID=2026947 RepID=A0A835WS21_9CHLO|nr:hypothetical protein HYH02_003307 [Chlamydomonas schloesseri]|eukprot:KAG2452283.1 hypothetical protein HYH02_003307 [Chlamydomonas schloesseri]